MMQSASWHDKDPGRQFWRLALRVAVAIEAAILVIIDAMVAVTVTFFFINLGGTPDRTIILAGGVMAALSALVAALLRKMWLWSPPA